MEAPEVLDAPEDIEVETDADAAENGKTPGNKRRIGVPVPYTVDELTKFKDDVLERLSMIEDLEHEKKAASDRIGGSIKLQHGEIRDLRTRISEGSHHEPVECELVLDWETKTRRWVRCDTKEIVETEPFWDLDYQRDMFETERENERRDTEAGVDEEELDEDFEVAE